MFDGGNRLISQSTNVVTFITQLVLHMKLIPTHDAVLIIKANKMHNFSTLFGKELYMFQTDLLPIIRSLNTVFTAVGICHTNYVACLQPTFNIT